MLYEKKHGDLAYIFKDLQVGDEVYIEKGGKSRQVLEITKCPYLANSREEVCKSWCPGRIRLYGYDLSQCYGQNNHPYTFVYEIVQHNRPGNLLDKLIEEL